jgi:sensor histidine kinase YesM
VKGPSPNIEPGPISPGQISISSDQKFVQFSLRDNAGGISEELLQAIRTGTNYFRSSNGHGLGIKFTVSECERNNYQFEIESDGQTFTRVTIRTPIADLGNRSSEDSQRRLA